MPLADNEVTLLSVVTAEAVMTPSLVKDGTLAFCAIRTAVALPPVVPLKVALIVPTPLTAPAEAPLRELVMPVVRLAKLPIRMPVALTGVVAAALESVVAAARIPAVLKRPFVSVTVFVALRPTIASAVLDVLTLSGAFVMLPRLRK